MRRASAFEAPARGSRLQQAKGQLVTAARNKRRSIGTHGGGSALGSFSDANAAQRGHGLSTQYERAGLPGYAESLKGDVTTAIDIVEKSEGFLYGGWKIYQQLKNSEYTDNGLLPHPFKPGTDSM